MPFCDVISRDPLPGEASPFPLQILSQSLLDLLEQISKSFQGPLYAVNGDHVHDQRRLHHLLHQTHELRADAEIRGVSLNALSRFPFI